MSESQPRTPRIPDHDVLRIIGRGSYGVIWLARSLTGTLRAVKVIDRANFENERSFQREFDGMSSFEPISRRHDGFVHILHVGRGEGFFYYIMELADDVTRGQDIDIDSYEPRTLKSDLDSRGRLPTNECIDLGISLTDALETLHSHGLIHRDIKPANLIFVRGVPKLADIGLVATSGQYSFVGTEGYVPPEGPGTAQSDIFSLGKVLYEITMGKDRLDFPEMATRVDEITEKDHLHGLNDVLLKACAAKASRRYGSAREMHTDLLQLQSGRPRAKPIVPWLIAAALVAAVVSCLVMAAHHQPASPTPSPTQAPLQPTPTPASTPTPTPAPLPTTGSLSITTIPTGGRVVVTHGDTHIRDGVAPLKLDSLTEGDYTIAGDLGLAEASTTIHVEAGKTADAVLDFPTGDGVVKITSAPGGAMVLENDVELGRTPVPWEDASPGLHHYRIHLDGYKDVTKDQVIRPGERAVLLVTLEHNLGPEPGKPWTNSLGMIFVPAAGVRFCIWETRVKDYAAFCAANARASTAPDFAQGDTHPVVLVNWHDAMDFCTWLTEKERREGLISDRQQYRLPTDQEWSEAAGLANETGATPETRDGLIHKIYPWGKDWPPPKGAGNFADQSIKKDFIPGYTDGFPQTAPVGSFTPESNGIYDLAGNVWEWCLEGYKGGTDPHDWGVLRGGSYANRNRAELETSYRNVVSRDDRDVIYGFRCVLSDDAE